MILDRLKTNLFTTVCELHFSCVAHISDGLTIFRQQIGWAHPVVPSGNIIILPNDSEMY
jgi:hypothetical protein